MRGIPVMITHSSVGFTNAYFRRLETDFRRFETSVAANGVALRIAPTHLISAGYIYCQKLRCISDANRRHASLRRCCWGCLHHHLGGQLASIIEGEAVQLSPSIW